MLFYFLMSVCISGCVDSHLWARLTYTWGNFIPWGESFPYLIKLLLITTDATGTLHTQRSQRSVHQQWRRKFQEALPRQVSTLTIETTSVSPSSCQPSCKPAVAVPIKSAMWESWKGACRCAFLQALSLVAASNVSLTLSSVCINIGVIWTWREAVAI